MNQVYKDATGNDHIDVKRGRTHGVKDKIIHELTKRNNLQWSTSKDIKQLQKQNGQMVGAAKSKLSKSSAIDAQGVVSGEPSNAKQTSSSSNASFVVHESQVNEAPAGLLQCVASHSTRYVLFGLSRRIYCIRTCTVRKRIRSGKKIFLMRALQFLKGCVPHRMKNKFHLTLKLSTQNFAVSKARETLSDVRKNRIRYRPKTRLCLQLSQKGFFCQKHHDRRNVLRRFQLCCQKKPNSLQS